MNITKFSVSALAIAVTFAVMPARAAQGDNTFVNKAAEGGMAEVQLAQLAQTKAQSQAVKDLANTLYNDHTKANEMLKSIASKDNITLPTSMDAKSQAEYNRLQGLSGADFDREFVKHAIKDHKEDINVFQREVNHGTNSDVKNWASQNLPKLQEHLRMAENAHQQLMNNNK